MNVFFDIETLPAPPTDPAWLARLEQLETRADPNFDADRAHRLTALDPRHGRILCVSFAVDSGPVRTVHGLSGQSAEHVQNTLAQIGAGNMNAIDLDDWERVTLHAFAAAIADLNEPPVFIGHNIAAFDVPWVQTRALYHTPNDVDAADRGGLYDLIWALSPMDGKPWESPIRDTARIFPFVRRRNSPARCISLDDASRILHVSRQVDTAAACPSGAQVFDCWRRGELRAIMEHCQADVIQTRAVYRRLEPLLAR